jgi:L-asparaginase II
VDKGVGIALKTTDGSNRNHIPALVTLMRSQGYISETEAAELERLQPSAINIHTGQHAGEMQPVL